MTIVEDRSTSEIRKRVAELPNPTPQFDLQVGWTSSYDGVFSNEFASASGADSILDHVLQGGRVIITARGGGAKTVVLTRVAKDAIEKEIITVFVALKGWTPNHYAQWRSIEGFSSRLAYLLANFSGLTLLPRDIQILESGRPRLIIVDGLNEVTTGVGQQILNTLDDCARYMLGTSVLVSDRLVRRDLLREERWEIGCLLPLTSAEINRQIERSPQAQGKYNEVTSEESALLRTPYFLNAFLSGGNLARTTSDLMAEYFHRHALTATETDLVAAAAFRSYADAARSFNWSRFRDAVGQDSADRLLTAGAVVTSGEVAAFDHHLKHDYLVARYVSQHHELWNSDTFNTITFGASSFETIRMLMEQAESSADADTLLRRFYDWNIYGAGYSIAEGRESHVSMDMQLIILAMFAERRWDQVIATARRANDTLSMLQIDQASAFLKAQTLQEVFDILYAQRPMSPMYEQWRALFTLPVGSQAPTPLIAQVGSTDSVIGWTSANVLKRLESTSEQQEEIRTFLSNADATVRWRAAHVLGTFPSAANCNALMALLETPDIDVRFGIVRSLVEMASKGSSELSAHIFSSLASRIGALIENPRVLAEFERALFIRKESAPKSWTRLASLTIAALQNQDQSAEGRERWEHTLVRMLDLYGR